MDHAPQFSRAKYFLNFVVVLAITLVMAQPTYAQDSSLGLFGKTWTLAEIEGQKVIGDKPNIEFDRDQKHVSGSGGCNRFSGTFDIDGSMIKFSPLIAPKWHVLMQACSVWRQGFSSYSRLRRALKFRETRYVSMPAIV